MEREVRVLIVEDSEDDVALMLLELRRAGFTTSHARVDAAAPLVEALEREAWGVVLCDHKLPRFNAPEALRTVRGRDAELPFVIVSSSIGEALVAELMRSGATDYVSKDQLDRLPAAVERALREAANRRERRRAEEALRESEERFALAVEGSRDGLWDWNLTTGRTYYSARLQEILGLEDVELSGPLDALLRFVHEEDRATIHAALTEHLERRAPFDVEVRVRTKAGEILWCSASGQARWDEAGRATRIAGSLSDITRRKRAEEALREQISVVEEQQRAIRELATPVIEVWDGVLSVPVLGVLDARRVTDMMDAILGEVVRRRCRHVILDVTGISSIDGDTADHVLKLVGAVELLGARGVVAGIQPRVAQAIVSIGVDLSRIVTLGSLRDALLFCMRDGARAAPAARRAGAGGPRATE